MAQFGAARPSSPRERTHAKPKRPTFFHDHLRVLGACVCHTHDVRDRIAVRRAPNTAPRAPISVSGSLQSMFRAATGLQAGKRCCRCVFCLQGTIRPAICCVCGPRLAGAPGRSAVCRDIALCMPAIFCDGEIGLFSGQASRSSQEEREGTVLRSLVRGQAHAGRQPRHQKRRSIESIL